MQHQLGELCNNCSLRLIQPLYNDGILDPPHLCVPLCSVYSGFVNTVNMTFSRWFSADTITLQWLWNQGSTKGTILKEMYISIISFNIMQRLLHKNRQNRCRFSYETRLNELDWSRNMWHWAVVAACSCKSVWFLSRLEAWGTLSPGWTRSLLNITSLPKTRLQTHWHTLISRMISEGC